MGRIERREETHRRVLAKALGLSLGDLDALARDDDRRRAEAEAARRTAAPPLAPPAAALTLVAAATVTTGTYRRRILQVLGSEPLTVAEVSARTGIDKTRTRMTLSNLRWLGQVESSGPAKWKRYRRSALFARRARVDEREVAQCVA